MGGGQKLRTGVRPGVARGFAPFAFLLLPFSFAALGVLFFATSVVGVVTGSNSLVTVPVMYQFGVDPRVAVATNMFGLTFMAVGGALPFVGTGAFDRRRLPLLVALTLVGSTSGALLVLVVTSRAMPLFISLSMLGVAAFSVFAGRGRSVGRDAGMRPGAVAAAGVGPGGQAAPARGGRGRAEWAGYAATLLLGVYGGFFSGGYVTLLTAAYVALFGMRFVEAVATTKLVNVFSSLVATLVFAWHGLVDYRLGLLLAAVMFAGANVGARVALRLNELWLRRVFLLTVVALALKILVYDFAWKGMAK